MHTYSKLHLGKRSRNWRRTSRRCTTTTPTISKLLQRPMVQTKLHTARNKTASSSPRRTSTSRINSSRAIITLQVSRNSSKHLFALQFKNLKIRTTSPSSRFSKKEKRLKEHLSSSLPTSHKNLLLARILNLACSKTWEKLLRLMSMRKL